MLVPLEASAYCVLSDRPTWTTGAFNSLPVRISTTTLQGTSIAFTSLGDGEQAGDFNEEYQWVQAAIDIISSAPTGAPRLYLASQSGPQGYDVSPGLEGITISVFGECTHQDAAIMQSGSLFALEAHNYGLPNRARIYMIRGGGVSCPNPDPDNVWWVDPDDDNHTFNSDNDFVGTLVHELLHALGLGHTNDPLNPSSSPQSRRPRTNTHVCSSWIDSSPAHSTVVSTTEGPFRRSSGR